ncbi:Eco57I restriction-modification methylase domain-containing protein [Sphingobacterium sp. SGL-16]|uniref:Eco57I restriction-modification methylase domain-containing protein n=1 Tax=Sphingobacterium sp. SGL-16 TaxID=2710883 RepID=UPI0013EB7736|nr:N-6 DNA methylase [Sphingobacterium sp. SGL-16]NGM72838.1 N-6 DNA methylase [Sphingobacterium sp. SGL-16]
MVDEKNSNLLPSEYADELGKKYTETVEKEHKKKLGQYFTPREIAIYLATFYKLPTDKTSLRILDPGCGLGVLSCGLCEYVALESSIREIHLDVFEMDLKLIEMTKDVLNYLQEWLQHKGVQFNYHVCVNDFVLHNTSILQGGTPPDTYDVAISNPPYFKISKEDPLRKLTKSILHGQQNIYSIFVFLMVRLLRDNGRIIFISPRSFTSGGYFKTFRDFIFTELKIEKMHLFHSRKNLFKRDKVLQENIIVSAKKRVTNSKYQADLFLEMDQIVVCQSAGMQDINTRTSKVYSIADLVNLSSNQKILHIPMSDEDEEAISIFKKWTNTFSDIGIKVSTGPVVSFRANNYIVKNQTENTVPLIWLNNVNKMDLKWPLFDINEVRPQYLVQDCDAKSLFVDNQNMVIIRRFSSKDDNSKLIAAPFFKKDFKYKCIGLENHVNYIYGKEEQLSIFSVWGVAALLNSTLFDVYFRTFNGNINVSATELRDLPLPDIDIILNLGKSISKVTNLDQYKLDKIVNKTFKVKNKNN